MRNVFSRRDFLKASAAAVLAASAAGVLTGCDGGGSEIPSATIGLGEFEVTMTADMGRDSKEDFGQNNLFYIYIPKVKIKYNGNGAIAIPFKDAFTVQITEKEVKPRNGSALIKSVDIPLGNTATYQPEFVFTVAVRIIFTVVTDTVDSVVEISFVNVFLTCISNVIVSVICCQTT